MKRTMLAVGVLAAACAVCCLVTYRLAYDAGFARAKQLQKGTFVGSFDVLQKLRAGDVPAATHRLESLCFSAADLLYSDPDYRDQFVTRTFAPELIHYRALYRTNRAEWTPVEQKLERDLASWRRP